MSRRRGPAGVRRFGAPVRQVGPPPPPPPGPDALPDLAFWYRGDTTEDVNGGVSLWIDLSGHLRDLAQATASTRPTPTIRAGQRALQFDGGDYLFNPFGELLAQPLTIYAVWEVSSTDASRTLLDGDDSTNRCFLYVNTTGPSIRAGAVTPPPELTGGTVATGQIYASCFVANGANSALFGRSDFVTAEASGSAGTNGLDGLVVGAANNAGLRWVGYIWEVIGYEAAHGADERALIGNYFTARYDGLTVTT